MFVIFKTAFDASNNFVDPYDNIIANCNFHPLNMIKLEILKRAITNCILKKSVDICMGV